MKKLVLLFGLYLHTLSTVQGQITFEKGYRKLVDVEVAKSVDLTLDGGYIVAVGAKLLQTFMRKDALIKLNAYGDTIFHSSYQIQTNVGNTQLVRSAPDGGYYASGVRSDSSGDHQHMLWIMKMDSMGNKLWVKNYTNTYLNANQEGNTMQILPNNTIFMYLFSHNILLADGNGVLDTLKTIPFYYPYPYSFMKKNLLPFKSNYYYFGTNLVNNSVAKIDSLGTIGLNPNLVLQVDTGINICDIVKITENNYYTASFALPLVNGKHPFTFSKFDSLGVKIWNKYYDFLNYNAIQPTVYATLSNGTNVVSLIPGNTGPINAQGRASIFCFNDNGDSLWYKYVSPSDTSAKTEIFDVIATPDSGLLAVGQILFSNGQQKSYMIKLDANGNLFNPMKIVERKKETYLHLYPNPATSYTGIHYMGLEKNAMLTIHNLQGQLIYSTPINDKEVRMYISTEKFKPGIYLCSISAYDRVLLTKKLVVLK
jgi:hypothetical protein